MITPEFLNEIMYAVEDRLIDVDNYILQRIAKRIMKSFENDEGNLIIPSTRYDIQKLLNSGIMYEEIQEAVADMLPEIQGAVRDAFYHSAAEITKQNLKLAKQIADLEGLASVDVPKWEQIGITSKASELQMTEFEIRQLEAAYDRTMGTIRNMTRTTANTTNQAFINSVDKAYMKAAVQGISVQTAVIDSIREMSAQGVECVTFGGKKVRVESAIATAVRTGVNQANGDIVLTRCAEMGVQYVKTSAHMGARVTKYDDFRTHAKWQGRVFSLNYDRSELARYAAKIADEKGFEWLAEMRRSLKDKSKKQYPDFVEECGYGDVQGICGANCRHSFYPYYPGIQTDDDSRPDLEANEERFRLDQKQRLMERKIREAKRILSGIKAAGGKEQEFIDAKRQAKARLYDLTEKYLDFCKSNNLKPRNMSLKV